VWRATRRSIRGVRWRPAHLALLVVALAPAYVGVMVISRGLWDRSYDSPAWNYLVFGGLVLLIPVGLVTFVLRDARRRMPPREPGN
jgi:hypothetical protein